MDLISSLQSIGFDWQVALAHTLNFLLVVWLLKRFVFSPLQDTIADRREKIESGVEDAKKAKEKRRQAKQERKAILEAAREKRQEIVSQAREQADDIVADAKTEAREAAAEIKQQARDDIAKEREQMREEMKDAVGQLAVRSAREILKREVSEQDHERLINEVITTATKNA
jgi:F-type H+-transporting ATPase subunit b